MTTLLDVAEAAERKGVEAMLVLVRVVQEYVEEPPPEDLNISM